jgi:hypothetical protein
VRRFAPIAFACLAHFLVASAAFAYAPGDTLTVILKPLPNIPSFVQPGGNVAVWANAPSSATSWSASIAQGVNTQPLSLVSATYEPTLVRWNLVFQVPPNLPEELFDLSVSCSSCGTDWSRHAVKVLPEFKSDFYFAQISDTHAPSHTFSSDGGFSTADTTGMADWNAVIDDLNLIHPEFILHTGDIVNEGELEEYLAMQEMGRAQQMISRHRDPLFLVSGNHDQGGWDPTPPPPGTARKAWWRTYGWKFLENPPSGYPDHSQDYSFDYGLLHCIGLEAYQNNGSYDDYRTDIWGKQSFTAEQMVWLENDIAAVPAGHSKLAYYHYDFGGTLPDGSAGASFSQINPTDLNLDGVIWGHNHGVAEGAMNARPFNLGLQSVIDRRAFRIFRVHDGAISPGPMHRAGGTSFAPTDSLSTQWSGPNDGTRARLTATITNRYAEPWQHARLVFYLMDHDSVFSVSGGTLVQTIRQGAITAVYVDVSVPVWGGASPVVSVFPTEPASVPPGSVTFALDTPRPNPFRLDRGEANIRFAIRNAGRVKLGVYDLAGRLVAMLVDANTTAGTHWAVWNGVDRSGERVKAGVYALRLESPDGSKRRKISVVP